MERKIIHILSPALLVLLLFASCDKEEHGMGQDIEGDRETIRFEIAVGTATAAPSEMRTRVATSTDGNYTSTWNNGDAIGVYIVKGGGGLQASGNWVDNMEITYNNGTWTPSAPLYYPTGNEQLHFHAYYPYNAAVTDALNMVISGLTDQSTAANLSKSDLLSASTTNVAKSNNPVQLVFSHALTMVELAVTGGGAGAQMSSGVTVTLEGCKPDISFNLSTGAAAASGSVASVKMYRVEQPADQNYQTSYTYRALIPAQTVAANTELFSFSQRGGSITRTLSHTPSASVALAKGEVKPYNITLQGASSTYTYAVGDYYPNKGFPILGVVFETSNGGRNGKIISMDFLQRINVRWGDPSVDENAAGVIGIRDMNDGYNGTKNLIIKHKDQSNFADIYKLFNWIYQTKYNGNENGMWYLPAVNEMKIIYNNNSVLFSQISNAGYTTPPSDRWYCTSTEVNTSSSYRIVFNMGGSTIPDPKDTEDWSTCVIAIAKF